MKAKMIVLVWLLLLASVSSLDAAESTKYAPPRFPSYVKPPKLNMLHEPKEALLPKEWIDFTKTANLPDDHGWHIHNLLPTYRVKVRGTKSSWITLIDKGELTAFRSPEVRALASRYGDPRDVLSDDWAPHLPGINAPGRYEDYAKDPWKTISGVIKRIQSGNYEGFYPPIKAKQ